MNRIRLATHKDYGDFSLDGQPGSRAETVTQREVTKFRHRPVSVWDGDQYRQLGSLSLTHLLVLSFSSLPLSIHFSCPLSSAHTPSLSFLSLSLWLASPLPLSLSPSFSLSTHPRLIEDWTQLKWLKQKSQTPFSCYGGGPTDIGHVLMYWQGRVIWTESRPNQIRRPDPYRSVSLRRMLIISDWEKKGNQRNPQVPPLTSTNGSIDGRSII